MGFLNAGNQEPVIAHLVKLIKDLKLLRQTDNIGVNDGGERELATRALEFFDTYGKIDVHDLAEVINKIRDEHPTYRDDFPHASDSSLDWIKSIEDYKQASAERIKFYLRGESNSANTKDASGKTLYQRFQNRLAWLQTNKIHRVKNEQPAEPAAPVLTPEQQAQADARKRLDAVYAKIDKAGGEDWQVATIRFRAWLKNKVQELIREKRGIGFIERHIDEAIRTQENGSIR